MLPLKNTEELTLGRSCWAFPLIGMVVGVFTAAVLYAGIHLGLSTTVAAWIALAAQLLITGAIHEDGLADSADGLASHRTREEKLAIMRDSHIGTFGVIALVVSLGLRAALLSSMAIYTGWTAIVISAAILSRLSMSGILMMPQARTDGLAALAGKPTKSAFMVGFVIAVVAVAWLLGIKAMLIAVAAVIAVTIYVGIKAKRQLGGVTGDIAGACQQLCEIAVLAILFLVGP